MYEFHLGSAASKYFNLCSSPNFAASKIVESGSSKPKLQIKTGKNKAFHICI